MDQSQNSKQQQGSIVFGKTGTVEWISRCPTKILNLSNLSSPMKNYGRIQVKDELWLCGGSASRNDEKNVQSRTCLILSLADGRWRTLEHKMNDPRIRPWMSVDGNMVIVRGGTTSAINSKTGCRATQEVYHLDNPWKGWVLEDVEEKDICGGSTQNINIYC